MITNIVMLVKDRWRLTSQALLSLRQHTPPADFNLTIVDDASTRINTMHWSGYVEGMRNATVIRLEKSRGITGQARNLGVYWAEKFFGRGDYLYLSDNDVYFTEDWLEVLTSALESAEREDLGWRFRLLGGGNHPYLQPNDEKALGEKWKNGVDHDTDYRIHSHDAIAGYTHLMRWETWDKYGPLDAHAPGTCQSEDHKFCQQIIADGGLVGSVSPAVVYACGLTNTSGEPAVGADVMPRHEGILQL